MYGRCLLFCGILCALFLGGCASLGDQYPEGLDESKKVAIFPVFVKQHKEAKLEVEDIAAEVFREMDLEVLSAKEVREVVDANAELQAPYERYTSLISILSFSDGRLSAPLGKALECDYFLLVFVNEWGYEKHGEDDYAVVQLGILLIDAHSGKVLLRDNVLEKRDWLLFRPELKDIAREMLEETLFDRAVVAR
ncbi:MAG: hypothetical protein K9K75_03290 [Deltaproteobacteria bacterium]|nr:hypothetical protein [Deltaproteobacteria bacterium]